MVQCWGSDPSPVSLRGTMGAQATPVLDDVQSLAPAPPGGQGDGPTRGSRLGNGIIRLVLAVSLGCLVLLLHGAPESPRWAQVGILLASLPPVYVIARQVTGSSRPAWLAAFLFASVATAAPDGADARSAAFVLFLWCVMLLVRHFRTGDQVPLGRTADRLRLRVPLDGDPDLPHSPGARVGLLALVLALVVAIALSHPPTALMLALVTGALVLAGRLRLSTLPAVAVLFALGALSLGVTPDTIADLGVTRLDAVVGPHLTSAIVAGGLTAIGLLFLWTRGRPPLTLAALFVAAPFAALLPSSGGEAMAQVLLYASPASCIVLSQSLFELVAARKAGAVVPVLGRDGARATLPADRVETLPRAPAVEPLGPPQTVDPLDTRPLRLALFAVSIASLSLGTWALVADAGDLRLGCFLVFAVVGIGSAPWQLQPRIGSYERLVVMFLTAATVLTAGPLLLRTLSLWHPGPAFFGVSAVAAVLHVVGLLRMRSERSGRARARLTLPPVSATVTAVTGAALCLAAASRFRDPAPGFYGFLTGIGPLWYAGVALLVLSLMLRVSLAAPVLLLSSVLAFTPALVYGMPRSQSAAKHVDFVQYIQAHGALESVVPVYNAYTGFFDAMAWLAAVTGMSDPLPTATWWPVFIGLFWVLTLRYVAGQVLATPRQCWVAVALAVLMNAIGGDYFSPQSLGLVLAGGVALTVSHQLSPYVAGGVLVVLATFGLVRPWWTPALVLGPCVAWSLLHWEAISSFLSLSAFMRLANLAPPATDESSALERLPVVGQTVWATVGGIFLVGCITLVTVARRRRDPRIWALAACPLVGMVIVVVQPYGQEGIFRAALFGIPWLAVLAAPVLAGERPRDRRALLVVASVLTVTFLVGSFGLDATNVIRRSDLAAVRQFQDESGPRPARDYFMLVLNAGDQPTAPGYIDDNHFKWSRDYLDMPAEQEHSFDPDATVAELTDRMVRYTQPADPKARIFALWSPVGAQYGEAYAIQSEKQAEELRDGFLRSPVWTVARNDDGTYLFRFDRHRYPGTPFDVTPPPTLNATNVYRFERGRYPDATAGIAQPYGPPGVWRMVFADEFDGRSLDRTKWSPHWFGDARRVNNVGTYGSNVSVAKGSLRLQLSSTDGEVRGGLVRTGFGHGRYQLPVGGVVEARVYFPGDRRQNVYNWPAWWASGLNWPSAGEHDIAEGVGGSLTVDYHGTTNSENFGTPSGGPWHNGFHVFTLHRKARSADVYWDGRLVESYPTGDNRKPEELILNIGISGTRTPVLGRAGEMRVDYVRAWEPAGSRARTHRRTSSPRPTPARETDGRR